MASLSHTLLRTLQVSVWNDHSCKKGHFAEFKFHTELWRVSSQQWWSAGLWFLSLQLKGDNTGEIVKIEKTHHLSDPMLSKTESCFEDLRSKLCIGKKKVTNREKCISIFKYLCLIFFNRRAIENKYEPSVMLLRNLFLLIYVHFLCWFTVIHKMVNTPRLGILVQYQCPIHRHRVSGSCIQRWSISSPHCSDYPQNMLYIWYVFLYKRSRLKSSSHATLSERGILAGSRLNWVNTANSLCLFFWGGGGGGAQPNFIALGVFFLTPQKLLWDKNSSQKIIIYPPNNCH